MSEIFIGRANGGFTQAVAAGVLFGLCNWLAKRWKNFSDSAKTEARRKALRLQSKAFGAAQYLFIFGFVWNGLGPLLTPDTPPSRREVLGIAVWAALGIAGFFSLVMAAFDARRTMHRQERQPENCSTEPANPTQKSRILTSIARTDSDMPKPHQAQES